MRPGALRAVPNRHTAVKKRRGSGGLARPAAPRYKQYAPQPTRLGLRRCLRHLPSSRARDVLLLGVDLWWLNDLVAPTSRFETEIAKGTGVDEHVLAMRWLIAQPRSYAAEALSIVRGGSPAIGISARERGGGF